MTSVRAVCECLLSLLLISLATFQCDSYTYGEEYVNVDYYIVNAREDDILVRTKEDQRSIIGFFLTSGETYHFGYHGKITYSKHSQDSMEQDDLGGLIMTFNFYAPGPDGRFEKLIGGHEFVPYLDENNSLVDTFFVR